MGVDLDLYVMDARQTPWTVVAHHELARNYVDFDAIQAGMREVPEAAIPVDHPALGAGEDGYGRLTFICVGSLPSEAVAGGSLFNAGVIARLRSECRPSQPVILWGH